MALQMEPVTEDLTTLQWMDEQFAMQFSLFPLDRSKALFYFEASPFHDRTSNNARVRQLGLDPARDGVLQDYCANVSPGVQYVVEQAQEPVLFVICKQMGKRPPEPPVALAYYYILSNRVYQAPSLHQVLTSRAHRCLWNLEQAFNMLQRDLGPLEQLAKTAKRDLQASGPQGPPPVVPRKQPTGADLELWVKTDRIIMHQLDKYPFPQFPQEYLDRVQQAQQEAAAAAAQQQQGAPDATPTLAAG